MAQTGPYHDICTYDKFFIVEIKLPKGQPYPKPDPGSAFRENQDRVSVNVAPNVFLHRNEARVVSSVNEAGGRIWGNLPVFAHLSAL